MQERLRDHAKAFDGLLSLIPAKMYYGEDHSDQWKKKKQTKEQAKAAKRGKLDPDSEMNRNAKEIMEERARNKRKARELEEEDDSEQSEEDDSDILVGVEKEKPGQGLKKQKIVEEDDEEEKEEVADEAEESAATEKPKPSAEEKDEKKKAKEEKKLTKEEKKQAKKQKKEAKKDEDEETTNQVQPSTERDADEDGDVDMEMAPIDVSGLADEPSSDDSTPKSPASDENNKAADSVTTASSVTSEKPGEKRRIKKPTEQDLTGLRQRLNAKLEALRAARKVAGEDAKPKITREELLEERRKKAAERKAHKREMRKKQKEEEDRKREEALASSRNSPFGMFSPKIEDDAANNNFSFGRLAFDDGTQMSHDLSYEKSAAAKKKGPLDPKSALMKLEAQKKRVSAMDEDKRKEVLEKEMWLAARRRAEGEKIQDDESKLKKAVKRKEKQKVKSANEWRERKEGVEHGIRERQKKREENLKKRREEKGSKKGKKKGGVTKKKTGGRPGFEGGGFGKKK